MLANPSNQRSQNCTEHTHDVMMAALYNTTDQAQIKANIGAHFDPLTIKVGSLKRAFASLASAALTTSDHGATVGTATFGAITRFKEEYDLSHTIYSITPDGRYRF